MKKYMYVGVLLGAIILAGCSVNEESEEQVQVKKEIREVVSLTPSELTHEQKEDYHKQYVEIVKEIIEEEGTNHMEVVPIDEFKPEDWVEPENFKQIAIERANLEFTSEAFGGDLVEE